MKQKIFLALLFLSIGLLTFGQVIKRIDGTKITANSLQKKVEYLMQAANVSGVAVSVFNNNKPVLSKTFGLANVQKNEALLQTSIMYGASFAKMVFAVIAMQYVQEKVLDLDKPLIEYLNKPLIDYKINGWKRGYQDLKR